MFFNTTLWQDDLPAGEGHCSVSIVELFPPRFLGKEYVERGFFLPPMECIAACVAALDLLMFRLHTESSVNDMD